MLRTPQTSLELFSTLSQAFFHLTKPSWQEAHLSVLCTMSLLLVVEVFFKNPMFLFYFTLCNVNMLDMAMCSYCRNLSLHQRNVRHHSLLSGGEGEKRQDALSPCYCLHFTGCFICILSLWSKRFQIFRRQKRVGNLVYPCENTQMVPKLVNHMSKTQQLWHKRAWMSTKKDKR